MPRFLPRRRHYLSDNFQTFISIAIGSQLSSRAGFAPSSSKNGFNIRTFPRSLFARIYILYILCIFIHLIFRNNRSIRRTQIFGFSYFRNLGVVIELETRDRSLSVPVFMKDGLYFFGVYLCNNRLDSSQTEIRSPNDPNVSHRYKIPMNSHLDEFIPIVHRRCMDYNERVLS